jgi:hypothetical protein
LVQVQQGELKTRHLQSKFAGAFLFPSNFQADLDKKCQQKKALILKLKCDNGGVVSLALLVIPEKNESHPGILHDQLNYRYNFKWERS